MYCKFYKLTEKPFNVTSDPAFFFSSRKHKEALYHLSYGINQRKGIIAITGEIGTGKTTILRFFLEHLGGNIKTAFILNPYFPEIDLLEAIMLDFGIKPKKGASKFSLIWDLNKFLLLESEQGNNVALIIDEAQNLTTNQLEEVRLLSNLETKKHKLLQIVLVGQPELRTKLNLHQLRQLQQRIAVRYHIEPLDKNEISGYINYRLSVAGSDGKIKFTDEAIRLVTEFSGGTPRLINIFCDRALLAGFTAGTFLIDSQIVSRCKEELDSYFAAAN